MIPEIECRGCDKSYPNHLTITACPHCKREKRIDPTPAPPKRSAPSVPHKGTLRDGTTWEMESLIP